MCHRRMAALTLLMKHIRQRDLMELLDKLSLLMVEKYLMSRYVC
ncbi:TPA: Rpn family recombination-promoting nuclease/putative transposase [Salmonella enterica subsp. salamae serovar 9,46:z4,z24:z39:z42]|nr:Rpn family recombination-promoting nuclease/putative transposase [Salmonella enterica subsp. salamae serovar 9,46:z4,z24:z39:z42]